MCLNERYLDLLYVPLSTHIQGSICRGGWEGLTPPLVVDDPLTGDRQFWSGGGRLRPPSPLQQDQDGMAVVFILVLIDPTGYCISLELKPASDRNKKTCAALFYSLVLCEKFGNLLIYCSAPCLACGDVSVASYILFYHRRLWTGTVLRVCSATYQIFCNIS